MANENAKKVGLLLVTRDIEGNTVAVLQRRGLQNHEKDWADESFPGGCQLTAAGKVNEKEHPTNAFWREVGEELGVDFLHSQTFPGFDPGKLITGDDTGEKLTYVKFVPRSDLDLIRLHPSTGGLVFVDSEGVSEIENLKGFDKVIGVTDLRTIAMFLDEKEVVRKALEIDWE